MLARVAENGDGEDMHDNDTMFNFQRLDVYQRAIEFLAASTAITDELPRGRGALSDQLRRAALSIPLNIAEAQGRSSAGEAARAYAIARGSAMECAAIIDAARVLNAISADNATKGQALLLRVVRMLTKLCR